MKNEKDNFDILRKLVSNPKLSQRELSKERGLSLGKVNYCLKELKKKGLIKLNNFQKNPNKLNYLYLLTPKGITYKTKVTLDFMKQKLKEYDELKSELKNK